MSGPNSIGDAFSDSPFMLKMFVYAPLQDSDDSVKKTINKCHDRELFECWHNISTRSCINSVLIVSVLS